MIALVAACTAETGEGDAAIESGGSAGSGAASALRDADVDGMLDASASDDDEDGDGAATGAPGRDVDAELGGSAEDAAVSDADADGEPTDAADEGGQVPLLDFEELPYAREVVSYEAGDFGGFGQDDYPDIVLGPPMGRGTLAGSLDVLSLGVGGEIVLAFDYDIVDGEGADFVVFENAFWPGGDASAVFTDLGEIAVSLDGVTWETFACDDQGTGDGEYPGCAGWRPTLQYDALEVQPLDPELTGGDAFDLSDVGLTAARYVRVRDLATSGTSTNAGFDLDAIGIIHFEAR